MQVKGQRLYQLAWGPRFSASLVGALGFGAVVRDSHFYFFKLFWFRIVCIPGDMAL